MKFLKLGLVEKVCTVQTGGRVGGRAVGHDAVTVTVAFRTCFTNTHTAGHDFLSPLRTKL